MTYIFAVIVTDICFYVKKPNLLPPHPSTKVNRRLRQRLLYYLIRTRASHETKPFFITPGRRAETNERFHKTNLLRTSAIYSRPSNSYERVECYELVYRSSTNGHYYTWNNTVTNTRLWVLICIWTGIHGQRSRSIHFFLYGKRGKVFSS